MVGSIVEESLFRRRAVVISRLLLQVCLARRPQAFGRWTASSEVRAQRGMVGVRDWFTLAGVPCAVRGGSRCRDALR
jgi:hypothetical protein